ncbi:hypothetical protein Tco_0971796 [Tanacetum coccineum]
MKDKSKTTEEKDLYDNGIGCIDAISVIIEKQWDRNQKEQDTSSRSGNDAHVDDADIRPIYEEEPMDEVQMTADDNVSATGQQHTEQPEFINEGEITSSATQDQKGIFNVSNMNKKSNENADVISAQIQKKGFSNAALKKSTLLSTVPALDLNQMTSDHNRSELGIQDHSNEQSSSKLVPKVVP